MIAPLLALALATGAAAAPAGPPVDRLDAANGAYRAGDFAAAAAGYEAVLAEGWESPTVHLDLGNARLRLGRRGLAVASYARALRLDPRDTDARENLRVARQGAPGGLPGEAPLPALVRAAALSPEREAAVALSVAWALLWASLAARRRAPGRARAGLAALATAAALGAGIAALLLAGHAAARRIPVAVVVVPTAGVREGPEPALRPVRELPEATAVRVLEVREDAFRVRVEDGAEGWMRAGEVEVL